MPKYIQYLAGNANRQQLLCCYF